MAQTYSEREWAVYDVLYDAKGPLFVQDIDELVGWQYGETEIEAALQLLLNDGVVCVYKGEYEMTADGREWSGRGR